MADELLADVARGVYECTRYAPDETRLHEEGESHVHVWSITSGMYALSAHVQTANVPLSECAPIMLRLENMLRDNYRIGHSTLQFECDGHPGKCSDIDGLYCQMQEAQDHLQAEATVFPIEKGS